VWCETGKYMSEKDKTKGNIRTIKPSKLTPFLELYVEKFGHRPSREAIKFKSSEELEKIARQALLEGKPVSRWRDREKVETGTLLDNYYREHKKEAGKEPESDSSIPAPDTPRKRKLFVPESFLTEKGEFIYPSATQENYPSLRRLSVLTRRGFKPVFREGSNWVNLLHRTDANLDLVLFANGTIHHLKPYDYGHTDGRLITEIAVWDEQLFVWFISELPKITLMDLLFSVRAWSVALERSHTNLSYQ